MNAQPRFFALEEFIAGRWHPASIPMATAKADTALAEARRADPTRRLRLSPAAQLEVSGTAAPLPSTRHAARMIYLDCRKAAA